MIPAVSEELIADVQERMLRALADGSCRRIASADRELMRPILTDLELPADWEEAQRQPGAPSAQRVAVLVAAAEAAWRLIGLGLAVPCEGSIDSWNPDLHYVRLNERGERDIITWTEADVRAPLALRLSAAGVAAVRDGTLAIRNPDLYMRGLDPISPRVTAAIREAVEAYRRDLPLATVILLGVASEAAWRDVGLELAQSWSQDALAKQLDSGSPASNVLKAISARGIDTRSFRRAIGLGSTKLETLALLFADLRNDAAHEVLTPVPIGAATAATMLYQARDYFEAVAKLRSFI